MTDDHRLTCRTWERGPNGPFPGDGLPGRFTSFSASRTEVCAVTDADRHVVRCFLNWPTHDKPHPPFTDTVIEGAEVVSIAQVDTQVCFVHRDQRISCWPGKPGTPRFPQRYHAITGGVRICAIDLQGSIACDRSWP